MNALLVAKLPKRTAHEAMTTARRYTAPEAEAAGILDATAEESAVVSTAVERAAALAAKAGPALGEIKTRLYAEAVAALAT
jgi:enoyl-CoA hydratase/carnithine racemase